VTLGDITLAEHEPLSSESGSQSSPRAATKVTDHAARLRSLRKGNVASLEIGIWKSGFRPTA